MEDDIVGYSISWVLYTAHHPGNLCLQKIETVVCYSEHKMAENMQERKRLSIGLVLLYILDVCSLVNVELINLKNSRGQ